MDAKLIKAHESLRETLKCIDVVVGVGIGDNKLYVYLAEPVREGIVPTKVNGIEVTTVVTGIISPN